MPKAKRVKNRVKKRSSARGGGGSRKRIVRKKRPSPKEYEPTLPSDERNTIAEKLLLGEELAQYAFGTAGSYLVAF